MARQVSIYDADAFVEAVNECATQDNPVERVQTKAEVDHGPGVGWHYFIRVETTEGPMTWLFVEYLPVRHHRIQDEASIRHRFESHVPVFPVSRLCR